MSQVEESLAPLKSLSPDLRSRLVESTNIRLLNIIRANISTQYASQSTSLANFRDAIFANGTDSDAVLLKDFQTHVPLTDYESYGPFIAKFKEHPCKESEVRNLLAPGLPNHIFTSSATSGKESKLMPIYHLYELQQVRLFYECQGPISIIFYYGYKELKEIVSDDDPDKIVKKIPICILSSAMNRGIYGWEVEDDDKRMSLIMPGCVTPWAASMINNHQSFLMMHGLYTLACRDLDSISISYSTLLIDLFRFIHEEWDLFVSSIRDGKVPALEGVGKFLPFLQAHLHANPERAAELSEIGPPLSREGWAKLAWPQLRQVTAVCGGPFATSVPKLRSIFGPNVTIRTPGITSSEATMGDGYRDSIDVLILQCRDHIEFLDIASEESHEKLCQAHELEAGKQYEVVLTTRHGLWRYRLGDVLDILGFDADDGQPIFKYSGRRGLTIRLPHALITDTQLITAVQAIDSDILPVHEFTTVIDNRHGPPTVGLLVEISGDPGPNSHLAPQMFFDGLVATSNQHQAGLANGKTRIPTVRILEPGTCMEYRQWMASKMNVGSAQIKLPVVMLNDEAREWILKRVKKEL